LCAKSAVGAPPAEKIASAFSKADKSHNNMLSTSELRPFIKQVLRSMCVQLEHAENETTRVPDIVETLVGGADAETAIQLKHWFEDESLNGAVLLEMKPFEIGHLRSPAAIAWERIPGDHFVWLRLRLWRDGSCQLAHFDGRKSASAGGSKGRVTINSTWDLLDGTFSLVGSCIEANYTMHVQATSTKWFGIGGGGQESIPWERRDGLVNEDHVWRRLHLGDLRLIEIQLVHQGCGFCSHEMADGMARFNFHAQTCF